MPGVTVTLPTICLVVDEVGEVANNEECSYDSNIFCKRNLLVTNSIVFEILAMQARIQGLAATAVLVQHWSEEVIHILHLSHTVCSVGECWLRQTQWASFLLERMQSMGHEQHSEMLQHPRTGQAEKYRLAIEKVGEQHLQGITVIAWFRRQCVSLRIKSGQK
jgi:hypothetical protein